MSVEIIQGDCLAELAKLDDKSVHCCVTSPPYWNLRDYGTNGQMGLEATPEAYVDKLVSVFSGVYRVLRDDGTLWLNLGSSYAGGGRGCDTPKQKSNKGTDGMPASIVPSGWKQKDMIPIPWLVALALQKYGWYLRQDIIWAKSCSGEYKGGSVMPESVTDRCTKAHEYIFLMSKRPNYFFDNDAIMEESIWDLDGNGTGKRKDRQRDGLKSNPKQGKAGIRKSKKRGEYHGKTEIMQGRNAFKKFTSLRNRRSVWTITTKGYPEAHFATFPPDLIRPCVLAGTPADVCSECGEPWGKVIERNNPSKDANTGEDERYSGMKNMGGNHQTIDGLHRNDGGVYSSAIVVDYLPTCKCNARKTSGTVLDPFAGSGTVGEVAEMEGRNSILIELNPEYIDLIKKRTAQMGLFAS